MAGLLTDDEDLTNRQRRAIQRRAMAGRDPTLTIAELEALKRRLPLFREQGLATERAIANLTPVPAIAEAVADPSLATITNAGVQTAAMTGAPKVALGLLGAGYGAAVSKDLGMFDGSANAQTVRQSNAAANAAKANADAKIRELKAKTDAERQAAEIEARRAANALEAEKAASTKAEFDRGLLRAEDAKAREFARDKRFSDTETAKMYEKTGGFTPFIGGMIGGGLYRAIKGVPKTTLQEWGAPAIAGLGFGEAAAHVPVWYNANQTEADNPYMRGWEAYAREAPPGPQRDYALAEAARLKKEQPTNPVHDAAQEEFYNPAKFAERSFAGLLQGGLGGKAGALVAGVPRAVASAVGKAVEGAATLPGRAAKGYNAGMTEATNEKLLRDFSDIRNKIAEARGFKMDAEADAALAAARARAAVAPPDPVAPPAGLPAVQPTAPISADTPAARAQRYLNSY